MWPASRNFLILWVLILGSWVSVIDVTRGGVVGRIYKTDTPPFGNNAPDASDFIVLAIRDFKRKVLL